MNDFKYQNIFFDLDGTLTDSGPGIMDCALYALHAMGKDEPNPERLRLFVGPPLEDSFQDRYGMTHEEALIAVEKYREKYIPIGVFQNEPYPGVAEMLAALKAAGKHLYIGTSKPLVMAKQVLDRFELSQYFDYIEGIGMQERGTKEEVLNRLLTRLHLSDDEKSRTVMVGDRFYDVEGARAMGLNCIGVSYGYGSEEELWTAGAKLVFANANDLKEELLK